MYSKMKVFRTLLAIPKMRLPRTKILITADLGQPSFDSRAGKFIEMLSHYGVPLTLFSPNEFENGEKRYSELKKLIEFANEKEVVLEIGSHSIRHELLTDKNPFEIVSTIKESLNSFRKAGISVYGFRAPYLSIETSYRDILGKVGNGEDILKYDSSLSFEGTLRSSRMHDFFTRKCPHKIANIWELPLSCLTDYALFDKLKRTDKFVCAYWKRKVDINIHNHNYFLFLIHPALIVNHFQVLNKFLAYCIQKYSNASFTTCISLVRELDQLDEKKKEKSYE